MLSKNIFLKREMFNKNLTDLFNFAEIGLYRIAIKPKIEILFCNEVIKNILGIHYEKIINDPLKIKDFLSKSSIHKIKKSLKTKADFNEIFLEWEIDKEKIILRHINHFEYTDSGEIKEIFGMTLNETVNVRLLNELEDNEKSLKILNELSLIENKARTKEEYFQFMLDLLITKFKFNTGCVYKKSNYNSEFILVYEYNSTKYFNNFSFSSHDKKSKGLNKFYFTNKIQKDSFNDTNRIFNITNSKFKFFVSIPIIFSNYQYGLVLLVANRRNVLFKPTSKVEFLKKIQYCISSAIMRYILSENLILLNRKTADINKELVEFNETVSHDIKNGLSSIIGFLELYELKKNREFLDKVYSKIEYLTKILEKNLELAKAGYSAKLRKVKNFEEVIKEVAETTIPHGIEYIQENFTIDLFCDEEKIRQVFTNIFNNAVKHGNPTKIIVEFIERKTEVLFIVSNNGKSIPEENMRLIFDHGFSTNGDSTGLGLSIVKKILETHSGTITVESSPERTSFIICLPKQ